MAGIAARSSQSHHIACAQPPRYSCVPEHTRSTQHRASHAANSMPTLKRKAPKRRFLRRPAVINAAPSSKMPMSAVVARSNRRYATLRSSTPRFTKRQDKAVATAGIAMYNTSVGNKASMANLHQVIHFHVMQGCVRLVRARRELTQSCLQCRRGVRRARFRTCRGSSPPPSLMAPPTPFT